MCSTPGFGGGVLKAAQGATGRPVHALNAVPFAIPCWAAWGGCGRCWKASRHSRFLVVQGATVSQRAAGGLQSVLP